MAKAVGIDFGTTNSVVAYLSPQGPKVIIDHDGQSMTPSVVSRFNGSLYVGNESKYSVVEFIQGEGVREIKRFIGTGEKVKFAGHWMEPYEIAAIILKKLKRNVDLYFGEDVKKAVITVPAEFSDTQRKEIMEAGKVAGFEVEKIINEPTAALVAYAYESPLTNKTILCYDFGGGTFDISVATVARDSVKVRCVGGDRTLGGSDIDRDFVNQLQAEIQRVKGCKLTTVSEYQLLLKAEQVKIELSNREHTNLNLTKLTTMDGRTIDFFKRISRSDFEQVARPHIENTIRMVESLLRENRISPVSDIDQVLLIGGSSRIPLVKELMTPIFRKEPTFGDMDADVSVALGAALEANRFATGADKAIGPNSTTLEDVSSATIGLKITENGNGNVFDPIIHKNFPYGREYSEKYHTLLDNQESMYLEIYQGDQKVASSNEHVRTLDITPIPQRKAGEEFVRVSFRYDENGILHVKARILSTGKEILESIPLKLQRRAKQTQVSIEKVNKQFIDEEKFKDINFLNQQLRKHGMEEESKRLEQALKNEKRADLEKVRQSLLD